MYEVINQMTGCGGHRSRCIIPADSPQERLELIRKGLEKLYSAAAALKQDFQPDMDEEYEFMVLESVEINDGPFTLEELQIATAQLKCGKVADLEGVTAETLKISSIAMVLLVILNAVLVGGTVPDEWLNLAMVLLFKKGDSTDLGNYHSITIINLVLKLYMHLILNRLIGAFDPHFRSEQNGFRWGRSMVQHVLALRRLIEETELS
jgi:hypothetical protein